MVLLLPHPWSLLKRDSNPVLTLELIEDAAQPIEPDLIEPRAMTPMVKEPIPIETPPEPTNQAAAPEPATAAPPIETVPPVPVIPQPSTEPTVKAILPIPSTATPAPASIPSITGAELIQQSKNSTSIEITPEFQARSGPATDFFMPEVQATDWYADIPYLDESVDKPQLEMRFYAEGIEGSVERFFDRITVKKTFTTKYGTKIHCAWIGVIVNCGWK